MRLKKCFVLFLLTGSLTGYSQVFKFTPKYGIVFDSANGKELLNQCSRDVPQQVTGYWTPLQSDIDSLENNFRKVYQLTGMKCCVMSSYGKSLDYYGFQYVGIKINAEKLIYINAFPLPLADDYKRSKKDLKTTPITVCDGGTSFWGAVYDVHLKTFNLLAFNGFG